MVDAVTSRVSNPLLSSFAISWVVINYKVLMVIMSGDHYLKKIAFFENILYAPETNPALRLFWMPLGVTAFYIAVLPALSLSTTAISAIYENLHERLKSWVQDRKILDIEQSKALRKELAATLEKLKTENQEIVTARIDTSRKAGGSVTSIIGKALPSILLKLRDEATEWSGPIEKMPENRTIGRSSEQDSFAKEVGLPKQWVAIFDRAHNISNLTVRRASSIYEKDEEETMDVLLRLAAVGMVDFRWVDDQLIFDLAGGRWGALLNGRPA